MNTHTRYTVIGFFVAFLAFTAVLPQTTFAFSLERLVDPLCVFHNCNDDRPQEVNYVNSNNVNSNVNSPGGVVSGNSAIIVAPPAVISTGNNNSNSNIDYYYDDYYYDYNDDYYDYGLSISCYPESSSSYTGQNVRWTASVWGGTGNYSYSWSGTEGLSGSGSSASIRYDRTGTKTAQLRVTSGGRTVSQLCSYSVVVYADSSYDYDDDYYDDDDLDIKCSVDDRTVKVGETVRYEADADGGTGSYRYEWESNNGFRDTGRTTRVEYNRPGTYRMELEVRSGNQYESRSCPTVRVEENGRYVSNNYYSNQNNSTTYVSDLSASCTADRISAYIGTPVTWTVYPRGGNGAYTYAWNGTDGLQSNQNSIVTGYYTQGLKSANVTVSSGGRQVVIACGSISITGSPVQNVGGGSVNTPAQPKPPVDSQDNDKETIGSAINSLGAASILSLSNAPWGFISILIILVLLGTIFYMIYNKNKL